MIMCVVRHVFCIHLFVPAVIGSAAVKGKAARERSALADSDDNACFLTREEVKCFR